MTKWGLHQECKIGLTFENQPMYFTVLTDCKKKYHLIISINAEKKI